MEIIHPMVSDTLARDGYDFFSSSPTIVFRRKKIFCARASTGRFYVFRFLPTFSTREWTRRTVTLRRHRISSVNGIANFQRQKKYLLEDLTMVHT